MNSKPGHTELDALVRLLDEPDVNTFKQIKDKICSYGMEAIPFLENAWENSFEEIIQQRSLALIHQIQFTHTYQELGKWAECNSNDLLQGYIIVSRYYFPSLRTEIIMRDAGKIIQNVWLELHDNLTGLERIKVVNSIIYEVYGFQAKKDPSVPDLFFVNKLLETKQGIPVSLGLLYLIICQSLKMPVYGIRLPHHFILAYLKEDFKENKPEDNTVLFYINPFNKGTAFTRNEIDLFLKQMGIQEQESFYTPCSNKLVIDRFLHELIFVYENSGDQEKADELKKLKEALK